jgi:pilus assembly protein CpaF
MEGNVITLQEIFSFQQTGIAKTGKVMGRFKFHGVRPSFLEKFRIAGINIPNDFFDPSKHFEV